MSSGYVQEAVSVYSSDGEGRQGWWSDKGQAAELVGGRHGDRGRTSDDSWPGTEEQAEQGTSIGTGLRLQGRDEAPGRERKGRVGRRGGVQKSPGDPVLLFESPQAETVRGLPNFIEPRSP
jgi:hypothetical protein